VRITPTNLIFEPATNLIIGLFDFDFGQVAHPLHEYVAPGIGNFGGRLADHALKDIIISGRFYSQPPKAEMSDELW